MRRREFLQSSAAAIPGLRMSGQARADRCILLNLVGGPSQVDTWDMKPDAPSDYKGPFRPIRTNVSGIEISEIFPRMAKHADKYALVRSVWNDAAPLHGAGERQLREGVADMFSEPERVRARYGENRFGRSCLRARRLVESGTRFVTVNMFETVFDETTWDIHGYSPFSPISCYRDHVGPMFDAAYSSLLEDLSDRGLLASTLVVAMGEFGRTPRINPTGGRDHWPGCSTVVMAGGGVRGGEIYGSSDKVGAEPRDNPVYAGRVAATIRYALGLSADENAHEPIPIFS
jgi:hypothetical protein